MNEKEKEFHQYELEKGISTDMLDDINYIIKHLNWIPSELGQTRFLLTNCYDYQLKQMRQTLEGYDPSLEAQKELSNIPIEEYLTKGSLDDLIRRS